MKQEANMKHHGQTRRAGIPTGLRSVACLVIVLSLVCSMGGALGQGAVFQPVPEFEAWIVEAEKGKKDPVDWALDKGKGEDWASKLDAYLVKRELAPIQADNAKLDAEVAKSKASLDKTTSALVDSYTRLLTIFESMKTRNSKSITSVEVEKIRSIYKDAVTPPEMRRRIELQFGSEIGASFRR